MKKIYFCGISGSGMSSLAQILKYQGNDVYGSDRNFDLGRDLQNKSKLEEIGIKIFPQDGSYVSKDVRAFQDQADLQKRRVQVMLRYVSKS